MYDTKSPFLLQQGSHAAVDLTSAAVQSFSHVAYQNCRVTRLLCKVTTATVSNVSIVVTFRRRPVYGSSSTQSSLGTITIPTAIAVDKIYYKDITPVNCAIGDQLVVEVTTAAGGGGAAGAALCNVEADLDPEVPGNQTNMVASA